MIQMGETKGGEGTPGSGTAHTEALPWEVQGARRRGAYWMRRLGREPLKKMSLQQEQYPVRSCNAAAHTESTCNCGEIWSQVILSLLA